MITRSVRALLVVIGNVAKKLFNAWQQRTIAAWRRERGIWRRTKNPPSRRHFMGVFMLVVSLPIMWYVAFHTGWMVWLSFSFSAFLAASYATFFSKPLIFVLIYMGLLVGGVARELFFEAGHKTFAGDLVGASVILALAIYVIWWSNELKSGNLPSDLSSPRRKASSTRTPRRRSS